MAGIYIHIPFCKQKCIYCNFYKETDISLKENVLECLQKELAIRKNYLGTNKIETVYFGGGTPSLLTDIEINRIIQTIQNLYPVADNVEITLESNPDDLHRKTMDRLRKTPINRISLGAQSFHNKDLQFLNRRHTTEQTLKAVENLKKWGFNNINLDLIFGLPNTNLKDIEHNLDHLFSLNVQHLSLYQLTYEEDTPLYTMLQKNKVLRLNDEAVLQQYEIIIERTQKAGFVHYEISNFAKEGFFSKHNSNYWKQKEYLGIGPSAHSYNIHTRSWNIANNKKYIEAITNNKAYRETEDIDLHTQYNEYILTSLRTMWGCNENYIKIHFGKILFEYFKQNVVKFTLSQHIIIDKSYYKLSKKGMFIADRIISELMNV